MPPPAMITLLFVTHVSGMQLDEFNSLWTAAGARVESSSDNLEASQWDSLWGKILNVAATAATDSDDTSVLD
jgi:hypothetical protein